MVSKNKNPVGMDVNCFTPKAVRFVNNLPTYGGQLCNVHSKTYELAKDLASLPDPYCRVEFSPRTGYVTVHRTQRSNLAAKA